MKNHLSNERGSVMVIALLIMAILTVLGISAINQSNLDLMIAKNERQYKQNFFRSEAAANEAIQRIDNADANDLLPESTSLDWLNNDGTWPGTAIEDPTNWISDPTDANVNSMEALVDSNARFAVRTAGLAGGASIDITSPSQLYEFEIHGQYFRSEGGWSQIAVGYRKRF
jgi:type IV pilus assembly protein PilX